MAETAGAAPTAIDLESPAATRELGRRIGAAAMQGDVMLLTGSLGAGKTVLVAGIAEGLGSRDDVASPTFVLVRHYAGRLPLVHADLYRLESAGDIDRLGLLDLAADGVLVVEWAERAPSLRVPGALELRLEPAGAEDARTAIVVSAPGHLRPALRA